MKNLYAKMKNGGGIVIIWARMQQRVLEISCSWRGIWTKFRIVKENLLQGPEN